MNLAGQIMSPIFVVLSALAYVAGKAFEYKIAQKPSVVDKATDDDAKAEKLNLEGFYIGCWVAFAMSFTWMLTAYGAFES